MVIVVVYYIVIWNCHMATPRITTVSCLLHFYTMLIKTTELNWNGSAISYCRCQWVTEMGTVLWQRGEVFILRWQRNGRLNKNAFQWDAYRPLVDRIPACTGQGWGVSQHALGMGVCIPACTGEGGCLPLVRDVCGRHSPCGQTDTCENITFTNLVCGR